MQLVVKFALNNRVHSGDKTIIHVPNEFEIVKRESFAIKSPSGETIANAVTDLMRRQLRLHMPIM